MGLDVVVTNYKTPDLLYNFVDSYEQHRFNGCTLTIVEVDAPNLLAERMTQYPNHKTIVFDNNCGYGLACNKGAEGGTNDVILLANADTLLSAGLQECHDQLLAHEDWGVLGPRQVNEIGRITGGGIFGHPKVPQQRAWNQPDAGQVSDVRDDALSVSGALYFIKRKVWDELTHCPIMGPIAEGAFLETNHYFEEMWCSTHARGHGYKVVYYGPVQMIHFWHRASPHGGWADQQFTESQAIYRHACAKHALECE